MDRCGRLWTPTDMEALHFGLCGRRLEIYGSGGWGLESLQACHHFTLLGTVTVAPAEEE